MLVCAKLEWGLWDSEVPFILFGSQNKKENSLKVSQALSVTRPLDPAGHKVYLATPISLNLLTWQRKFMQGSFFNMIASSISVGSVYFTIESFNF